MSTITRFLCTALFMLLPQIGFGEIATPEAALQQMLEHDMAGDPSVRVDLATPQAVILDITGKPSARQNHELRVGHFFPDSDPLVVTTGWRIEGSPKCRTADACVMTVVFRVVAKTKGYGSPRWSRKTGREIVPLAVPIEERVQYRFQRKHGKWQLNSLPAPRVSPQALRNFFGDALKRLAAISYSEDSEDIDKRAIEHTEVIQIWRQRQLDTLDRMLAQAKP